MDEAVERLIDTVVVRENVTRQVYDAGVGSTLAGISLSIAATKN